MLICLVTDGSALVCHVLLGACEMKIWRIPLLRESIWTSSHSWKCDFTESFSLEYSLDVISSLPSCSRQSSSADLPEPSPVGSWICPDMKAPQPAEQPLWSCSLLVFKQNLTFQLLSSVSCAIIEHAWEDFSCLFFICLIGYLHIPPRSLKIWQFLSLEWVWDKNSLKEDKMMKFSGSWCYLVWKRNRTFHGLQQSTGQCLGWRLDGPIIRRGYEFPQTGGVLQVLCHEEVEIPACSQWGYVRSKTRRRWRPLQVRRGCVLFWFLVKGGSTNLGKGRIRKDFLPWHLQLAN